MSSPFEISITSEVGRLEGVILHRPGPEVAHMTPETARSALYSDILNLTVAEQEYEQLHGVLARHTQTFEVCDLLRELLADDGARETLIRRVCEHEAVPDLAAGLLELEPGELTRRLIEGVPLVRDNLTRFLSRERFALPPLHNFFFTRDAAAVVVDRLLVGKMASRVRDREALIMEAIFDLHPLFRARSLNPTRIGADRTEATLEGGDVLVAREDVLLVGIGARTSSQAVDALLEQLPSSSSPRHVLVQQLPRQPESFIHLDMVFTLLDRDACMVYSPLVLEHNYHETVSIRLEGGRVAEIHEVDNLLAGLHELKIDLEPIHCGGTRDRWTQEREQWHSGTNFFALAPGKVIGYARNVHTIEELDRHGFAVLTAEDVIAGKADPESHARCVITINGSELARGGGGCRCMTLPLRRAGVG